ncbi:hypothetical protein [Pyruvatibacter sp.]|uniref:hypothetical protein n=1 Tax=Pyruvatibacter sp. TaxID=1981328 RepID=UPI0032EE73F7
MNKGRDVVSRLGDLFESAAYPDHAALLRETLEHDSEQEFLLALNSNNIWGGAGSIADQAFSSSPLSDVNRAEFARLMAELADFMLDCDVVKNDRLHMWRKSFRQT